ncbi:glycerol-3-phosphate dehydrogenase [Acinetobacter sp. S40]|uniref:glycerol-3-phosphate dehydrogenase n=1 Tax=unclassified Acinetobacter TaxID=196816 RepID=UPI00190E50F8|nr:MULTISPECIES: glycerol-3-phosphate dehydrogenase [unclassified Acinetobacter]MBJ9985384.1 glycerol-3-phosphate dehydrogenase [Acinetobacter sp. S40]MBK0063734.1 glycerol-3-phosphate dehydrogenase [Acinetobacter sp. S55]MBK0066977.1 glycerol-3-phosphate dehydrogenase [Acinetobacter sp. S54]
MTSHFNDLPFYDLAVIGGGINGVGIANDAAGRGLSVFLCEKDDFASHTSSASSKLIHGGLRYLEHFEFRLVREALAEREILMAKAPHIIRPLRFVLPHRPHLRPAWLIRSGLFLYDYLGKREKLPASKRLVLDHHGPLKHDIVLGFEYSDCAVDDARLVILNAIQAREKGAELQIRTECIAAEVIDGIWLLTLRQQQTQYQIRTKALINAAGPWVEHFIKETLKLNSPYKIRQIQGSHLIVPKLYEGDYAYILQNEDRRIVFTIPYLHEYTLIGTTDQIYQGDLEQVEITSNEIEYLLAVVNLHFEQSITQADIIETFSGVRPLCDDESDQPSAVTRDYTLAMTTLNGSPPLLSIFGGKLTTYRKLAEAALDELSPYFSEMQTQWTEHEPLPGGEHFKGLDSLIRGIQLRIKNIPTEIATRWASSYGTRVWQLLRGVDSLDDFGIYFEHSLYQLEVDYLIKVEWAQSVDDILWRRSKLGLKFDKTQVMVLDNYLQNVLGNQRSKIA